MLTLVLATVAQCLFCFKSVNMNDLQEHPCRVKPCVWMGLGFVIISPPVRHFLLVPVCCGCQIAAGGNVVGRGSKSECEKADLLLSRMCPRSTGFS